MAVRESGFDSSDCIRTFMTFQLSSMEPPDMSSTTRMYGCCLVHAPRNCVPQIMRDVSVIHHNDGSKPHLGLISSDDRCISSIPNRLNCRRGIGHLRAWCKPGGYRCVREGVVLKDFSGLLPMNGWLLESPGFDSQTHGMARLV